MKVIIKTRDPVSAGLRTFRHYYTYKINEKLFTSMGAFIITPIVNSMIDYAIDWDWAIDTSDNPYSYLLGEGYYR